MPLAIGLISLALFINLVQKLRFFIPLYQNFTTYHKLLAQMQTTTSHSNEDAMVSALRGLKSNFIFLGLIENRNLARPTNRLK